MTAAVEAFGGLEHAMELVADFEGVRFVNDSKATNVEAAVRSIESFPGGVVAIVGGQFKGGDLRLLRTPIGGTRQGGGRHRRGEGPGSTVRWSDVITVRDADSMEEAVATAFELARPSGVVVLAPACASFDMFRDYAERGQTLQGCGAAADREPRVGNVQSLGWRRVE